MLLVATLVSAQTPPQTPPQQTPVFRASTTVVPLAVTVRNRRGEPVTDLTQADFTVIENKKKCEIVNFFLQRYEPGPVPPPSTSINRVRDETVKPHTRRTFLIVLGWGRIQKPTNALDGAIDLIRNKLLPQDAVAVMGFHRATNFTTDHDAIAKILERYKKSHEKIAWDIDWWIHMATGPTRGHGPIPDKFFQAADDVFLGPPASDGNRESSSISLRRVSDLLLGMDRAVPVVEKPWERQPRFADLQDDLDYMGVELNDAALTSTRLKILAGMEYMRYLDGDKHMVVFSNPGWVGANADPSLDARLLAQRASDARVILDLVATNGTSPDAFLSGDRWGREVAERSGGFYTSVDMAVKAVGKIDRGTRSSYLLGYEPTNPELDGKFRNIEVKVNRPDLIVEYRQGYYAAADPPPLVLKELIVASRVETALSYDNVAKDIPLAVTAQMLPKMGVSAELRAEIVITATGLALTPKDGRYTGQLELVAYVGDGKQNLIGQMGERLDLDADEVTRDEWLKNGIKRRLRIPVFGVGKHVKVVVYDYGSDRAGSFMLTLK